MGLEVEAGCEGLTQHQIGEWCTLKQTAKRVKSNQCLTNSTVYVGFPFSLAHHMDSQTRSISSK
jgi:hypothetical protein